MPYLLLSTRTPATFCYVTHVTADCAYNQYTYREAAKIKQKNQWRCRWTRVQCPNGFGPRHASRPGPCCYFLCDLFVSVRVTLRAHSALTSAIRRTRRRHQPRILFCYLFVSVTSAAATGPVCCFVTCLFQS